MSNIKFANIARLMTTYNLEFVTEILPDNLKCVKCKVVLKNACQVPCGCRCCRVCIEDLMASGIEFCPGVSKDCGESLLSDFVTDYVANKSVAQLTVKCPQNGCVHVCELAELDEHMRVCGRKNVACPFHELGCEQDKLTPEEMSRHFQQDNHSHSKILIVMITNINREMESHKREIEMLKRSDEIRKMENEMLKHELMLKDETIRLIMDQMGHMENEIKSIKEEKVGLADRVQILLKKIDREIEERRESDERDIANVIEHIDREITTIIAVIRSNKSELDMAMISVTDDIRSINQDSIKSIMSDIDCINSKVQLLQEPAGLEWIEWKINEDIEWTGWKERFGEYFTGVVHPYKYRLSSRNYMSIHELRIWLCISPGASDAQLPWTWSGTVTIKVADRRKREACQKVTLVCGNTKPADNNWTWSNSFKFSHSSLIWAGLDLGRGVRISCVIVPSSTDR